MKSLVVPFIILLFVLINFTPAQSAFPVDTLTSFSINQNWVVDHWVNRERITDYYTSEQPRPYGILWENWNDTAYSNSAYWYYEYNKAGQTTLYITYDWQTDKFVNSRKDFNIYDTAGRRTDYYRSYWESDDWGPKEWFAYRYDSLGRRESDIRYLFQPNTKAWLPYFRWLYYYNDQGVLDYVLEQNLTSEWEDTRKDYYTFDDNGRIITQVTFMKSDTQWVKSRRYENSYNIKGQPLLNLIKKWNVTEWVNEKKTEYEYNVRYTDSIRAEYNWAGEWIPRDKISCFYLDTVLQSRLEQIWINGWVNYYLTLYDITEGVDDLENQGSFDFSIYPNPAGGSAYIRFEASGSKPAGIEIIDINGRPVSSRTIVTFEGMNELKLNLDGLAAGHYMIKLNLPQNTYLKKLSIIK